MTTNDVNGASMLPMRPANDVRPSAWLLWFIIHRSSKLNIHVNTVQSALHILRKKCKIDVYTHDVLFSVLFFSRSRSEGWPHHGRTFSIYPCPLSFRLTVPWRVLSTCSCCPSRPCVVFLACLSLALFLTLSFSPGNSLVSSWCDHSMLASLLWRRLTVYF